MAEVTLMTVTDVINTINFWLTAALVFCYAYELVYTAVALFGKNRPHKSAEAPLHNIAVLVAAKNEERVIGNLLESLARQDYPAAYLRVFVAADNCTDGTAAVARAHGATVFERGADPAHIGKGYVIQFLLEEIERTCGKGAFDAYVVFDADNLAESDFITEINRTYSDGYEVVTSYRNSKNYGDNWITAGSGLWFLRDAAVMNDARMKLGACAYVAGTGFLFSEKIRQEYGGWPFHTLTEDAEFTACSGARGHIFGYCGTARFYDEQPRSFRQSWRQRVRWARGGLQVFARYAGALFRGLFSRKILSCFDLLMCIAPACIFAIATTAVNVPGFLLIAIFDTARLPVMLLRLAASTGIVYVIILLTFALPTVIKEWRHLHTTTARKILYTLTFPLFIFTYVPVEVCSFFVRPEWKPIEHTDGTDITALCGDNSRGAGEGDR